MELRANTAYISPRMIRDHFRLERLEHWSDSLILLEAVRKDRVRIGGIWGEFTLQRTELGVGLRFSLLECPYALSWTISSIQKENANSTTLQMNVNRDQLCSEMYDEMQEVMAELTAQLEMLATRKVGQVSDSSPYPSCRI